MVAAILRHVVGGEGSTRDKGALVDAYRRQIERALREERWRFADLFCDKILGEDPRSLETWLLKGHLAWHRFRDVRTAVSCYRQVIVLGAHDSSNALVAEARNSLADLADRIA